VSILAMSGSYVSMSVMPVCMYEFDGFNVIGLVLVPHSRVSGFEHLIV